MLPLILPPSLPHSNDSSQATFLTHPSVLPFSLPTALPPYLPHQHPTYLLPSNHPIAPSIFMQPFQQSLFYILDASAIPVIPAGVHSTVVLVAATAAQMILSEADLV